MAFVGTKSYKKILEWVYKLDLMPIQVLMYNRHQVTSNFAQHAKIIALGTKASKHLESYHYAHFKFPHPSGRNRKLNDKTYEKRMLQECYKWIRA
jgi:hypothetical protein